MFTILPHTADVRLLVTGEDLRDVFASALKGMAAIQRHGACDVQTGKQGVREKTDIRASDKTTLLIDFLSHLLTLSHIHKVIFCHIEFDMLTETHITATITGYPVDYTDEDIKAVTYHEADLQTNETGALETMIIFDI